MMKKSRFDIDAVLDYLSANRVRATYKAVGQLLGVEPIAVSKHLGAPCPRESWIVSSDDKHRPTDYKDSEMDPALFESDDVIKTGDKLHTRIQSYLSRLFRDQAFIVSHADDSPFKSEGLRAFFEYRKMGIAEATNGNFDAHVIRAVPGRHSEAKWHVHDLNFQLVFVTKGWVVFEYEDQGEHILRAGSCVLQPPGIHHREVRHSDDMELIEIVSPADFGTCEAQEAE